jgi:hypothetical protein
VVKGFKSTTTEDSEFPGGKKTEESWNTDAVSIFHWFFSATSALPLRALRLKAVNSV